MKTSAKQPVLRLRNLSRTFQQGHREIRVLRDVSADFYPGEAVALVGPSGAGKSSLLHIVGLLEQPDHGEVFLNDVDCIALSDVERTRLRRTEFGFIYQFHQLLPEFNAMENIVLPQLIRGAPKGHAKARALYLLESLGIAERADHRPAELSGGEQQRVAIARAIANGPKVLLADEPTGNLDPKTAERVFYQLIHLVRSTNLAAIIATHNLALAAQMDRVLRLDDGRLVEDTELVRQR
ncbi:lipoprotein-releasing system ATP-binding protein LolD [bacterium MnTg02]|nr:lipoprotein-releasing system ATP-binding protein LolD [bacterium MnTg02]